MADSLEQTYGEKRKELYFLHIIKENLSVILFYFYSSCYNQVTKSCKTCSKCYLLQLPMPIYYVKTYLLLKESARLGIHYKN